MGVVSAQKGCLLRDRVSAQCEMLYIAQCGHLIYNRNQNPYQNPVKLLCKATSVVGSFHQLMAVESRWPPDRIAIN